MKLLSRSIIALLICLIAIPIMATPVQATGAFYLSQGSISSDEGYVGDEIRISGHWDDTHGSYIYIYYELYNEDEDDWDYVRVNYSEHDTVNDLYYFYSDFDIPESCMGEHDIFICHSGDPDHDVDTLQFNVYPSIEIDDTEGPVGTEVGVTGKGWHENESEIEIRFYLKDPGTSHLDDRDYYREIGPQDIEVDDYGSWEDLTFEVPPSQKGDHKVYAVGDKADDLIKDKIKGAEEEFEVLPGISLDTTEGYVGDNLEVTGSGFEEDEGSIRILFDNATVATGIVADEDGCWEKTLEVPELAMDTYAVTADGTYTDKKDIEEVEFKVKPSMVLSPTEGHVDTSLSVTGKGFPANKPVSVTYDQVAKGSSTTNSNGSFSGISFEATHTQSTHTVNHPVVVTCSATTFTANFAMESQAPPKPALTAPANNSRVGFIRNQAPTFQWSAVTDDSGISYNFQIATSADFAYPILSRTGLSETSYTLSKIEALPYGTYYWRVKAVDGAQNIGEWSNAYFFKSGLLPLWAFIVAIVLIVVLIGVLVYFFGVKRRIAYD